MGYRVALPLRDARRLAEIVATFTRFGGGWLLERAGLGAGLSNSAGDLTPVKLREALEALGPVFVKLGQILSTRRDLIDDLWADALSQLRAQVTALPWSEMEARAEAALGRPWREVFSEILPEPIGSASIGQVYAARLLDGTDVVIKITRPDQEERIQADLRLLEYAAARAAALSPGVARYQPAAMVRELARAIRAEFDLTEEAENTEEMAANFAGFPKVRVPKVWSDYSSRDLMVQERIFGTPPSDAAALAAAGLDGPALAAVGAEAFMHSLLVERVFHADPHPGNLFALPDNHMAFIDFGMVGRLTSARQRELMSFLKAIVTADPRAFAKLLLRWSGAENTLTPPASLEAAAGRFIARHSRKGLDLSRAITDIMEMVREEDLALPPDLVLLFKAMATADGTMKLLDPQFDSISAAKPFVARDLLAVPKPEELAARLSDFAGAATAFGEEAPELLRAGLTRLSEGKLRAEVSLASGGDIARALEQAARRIAGGLVLAALLLTMGPVLAMAGPQVAGLPLGSWVGIFGLIGGVWHISRRWKL